MAGIANIVKAALTASLGRSSHRRPPFDARSAVVLAIWPCLLGYFIGNRGVSEYNL